MFTPNFFTIFVGLFDKVTKTQIVPTDKAEDDAAALCIERFGGATISRCVGVYRHENGDKVKEPTLRIEIGFVTEEEARSAAEALRDMLNQESVGFKPDFGAFEYI